MGHFRLPPINHYLKMALLFRNEIIAWIFAPLNHLYQYAWISIYESLGSRNKNKKMKLFLSYSFLNLTHVGWSYISNYSSWLMVYYVIPIWSKLWSDLYIKKCQFNKFLLVRGTDPKSSLLYRSTPSFSEFHPLHHWAK